MADEGAGRGSGAPASFADLELGSLVLSAGGTGMTRTACATDIGYQHGRSSKGNSVRRGEAGSRGGAISGKCARLKQGART
jgi:hypothetical protein